MIIDSHIHLWDKIDGLLGNKKVKPVKDGMIQIGSKTCQGMPAWFTDCRNPAELVLAVFDEVGVDGGVVNQGCLDGNQNDYLLKVKKKYPKRFFVYAWVDFTKPSELKKEFSAVVKRGFKGVIYPLMPTTQNPIKLDSPALMAIWEEMAGRGMILAMELFPGKVQTPEMRRVLEHFPDLKVTIGHFGFANHKNWMDQIRLAEFKNVYIECGGIIWLFRHENSSFKKAQAKLKQAVKAIGAKKMMWGSDYPRTMVDFTYRQSLEFVTNGCEFLTEKEKADFLGGNAARLYGFKRRAHKYEPRTLITEL